MGALDDAKVLVDGEVNKDAFRSMVIESLRNVKTPSILGTIPIGFPVEALIKDSETGEALAKSFEDAKSDDGLPDFNKLFIEMLYGSIVKVLNVNALNVLKPAFITDPTQPLVDVISLIKDTLKKALSEEIFDAIGIEDSSTFIADNISTIMANVKEFTTGLLNIVEDKDDVEDLVTALMNIESLKDHEDKIEQALKDNSSDIQAAILSALPVDIPDTDDPAGAMADLFPIPELPDFVSSFSEIPIPSTGLPPAFNPAFEVPSPSIANIIATAPIAFIDAITSIMKEIISSTVELVNAISEGIEGLLNWLIDKIKAPIELAFSFVKPILGSPTFVASIDVFLHQCIGCAIVTMIGVLLGSGMISFSVANLFGLVG